MTESTPDSLFRPDNAAWRSLSPRYVVVKRLSALITSLVFWCVAAAASWIALQLTWLTAVIAGVGLAWTAWRVVRAGRWVRSWGWAERDSDLCITHGLWTRELTVIPFGRLQMVGVSSGPLLRSQGLANVQPVSYTHLDVYKRQGLGMPAPGMLHGLALSSPSRTASARATCNCR